jgi:tRNA(Ile)-lysidine synthetase-like protein
VAASRRPGRANDRDPGSRPARFRGCKLNSTWASRDGLAADELLATLAAAVERGSCAGDRRWLIAFSGGPDSLALAAAIAPPAPARGLAIDLVHVDHRLDPGSGPRAERARALARRLGLPFRLEVADVEATRRRGESREAAARRVRYAILERVRAELGAARILTAHQRDDQVETVLLRLLRGGPVESLAGIPERRGAIWRPLLAVSRAEIERFLAEAGLEAIEDPTNRDPAIARNLVRHHLLPRLRAEDPGVDDLLLAVGRRAAALAARLARVFAAPGEDSGGNAPVQRLRPKPETKTKTFIEGKDGPTGASPAVAAPAGAGTPQRTLEPPRRLESTSYARKASSSTERLVLGLETEPLADLGRDREPAFDLEACAQLDLPPELRVRALRWRLSRAGIEVLPSWLALQSFVARAGRGERARVVWGGADGRWELRVSGGRVVLAQRQAGSESRTAPVSYTCSIPGEVELPELGLRLRIRRSRVEPWMFRGDPRRAALALPEPLPAPAVATARHRRPGDRLRPLGGPGERKLKDLLIDRRVPARERDRLPIVEIGGRIAWVPGVAIDERFRLAPGTEVAWRFELEEVAGAGNNPGSGAVEAVERESR